MCYGTSRAALNCTKFHARTFSTCLETHFSSRYPSFGVWSCQLQHQHPSTDDGLFFSLGDKDPLIIPQVQIPPTSHHLSQPLSRLPLQMTLNKSLIHQSPLRCSNCSVTGQRVQHGGSCAGGSGIKFLTVALGCLRTPLSHLSAHFGFFLGTKKWNQMNWDWFFWEGENGKQVR